MITFTILTATHQMDIANRHITGYMIVCVLSLDKPKITSPSMTSEPMRKARMSTTRLETKDLEDGAITPLNYVKFQKVTTLTIFIADNQQGTDVTRIDKLLFYGSPVNTTNMQNFKRVAGKSGEAHS
ncbi:unnamed protein product [Dicrocoelium dendriticum]|nr:unnamed protein product [Dicrocoelium dendriticum]